MKRYLLFTGQCYYASGGWEDFEQDFDDLDEAKKVGQRQEDDDDCEWWHIVDTITLATIACSKRKAHT